MPKNYLGLNISHKPFKYNSLSDIFSIDSSFAGNSKWQLTVIVRQILYHSKRQLTMTLGRKYLYSHLIYRNARDIF